MITRPPNRRGAGRPRGRQVPHVARPLHAAAHPVHVTMRAVRGLPSLREHTIARAIGLSFHTAKSRGRRVTQFSIQRDHLHLIFEADDRATLMKDIRAVAIAIAKRVNGAIRRLGQVFAERYHARALLDGASVRKALIYVLMNHRKHAASDEAIDPISSARWFDGWRHPPERPSTPSPVAESRTDLGRSEWRRHGLIDLWSRPRGSPPTRDDYAEMARFFTPTSQVIRELTDARRRTPSSARAARPE